MSGLEVEAVLLEHAKVRECAVVGFPDPDRGEIVKAFVVLTGARTRTGRSLRNCRIS